MKTLLATTFLVLLVSACATPHVPLAPVTFDQSASVSSDKTVKVHLVSGAVRGSAGSTLMPVGTIFVPISTGPYPHLQFNVEDQRVFVDSFRNELQRLKVFRAALEDRSVETADFAIQVIFAQTFHNPNHQEYTLDVVMEMAGGAKPFLKQYRVVSSEGDSWWEKMNTNASEGKIKAGKKLLRQLIPDVETYIAKSR